MALWHSAWLCLDQLIVLIRRSTCARVKSINTIKTPSVFHLFLFISRFLKKFLVTYSIRAVLSSVSSYRLIISILWVIGPALVHTPSRLNLMSAVLLYFVAEEWNVNLWLHEYTLITDRIHCWNVCDIENIFNHINILESFSNNFNGTWRFRPARKKLG